MKTNLRTWMAVTAVIAALGVAGCSNELNKSASPIQLVVTNSQLINRIDLGGNAVGSTACDGSVGTISVQALQKNPNSGTTDTRFLQVRIKNYRVSYVRTDGGSQVPASFVRTMDSLITAGGSAASLNNFVIVQSDALTQAPFVALLPANGGRDPVTGRTIVRMDVIVEVFGETLAGDAVSGSTRFPLDFCFQCGGCA